MTPLSLAQQMVTSCNYTVYSRDSADKPLEVRKGDLPKLLTKELLMKCVFVANEALSTENISLHTRWNLIVRLDDASHEIKQGRLETALKNAVHFMNLNEREETRQPTDAIYLYTIERVINRAAARSE